MMLYHFTSGKLINFIIFILTAFVLVFLKWLVRNKFPKLFRKYKVKEGSVSLPGLALLTFTLAGYINFLIFPTNQKKILLFYEVFSVGMSTMVFSFFVYGFFGVIFYMATRVLKDGVGAIKKEKLDSKGREVLLFFILGLFFSAFLQNKLGLYLFSDSLKEKVGAFLIGSIPILLLRIFFFTPIKRD